MRWLTMLRRRARFLVDRKASEREIDDEMRFHLEMEAEELARFGASATDARRAARIRFGGVDRYKDEAREARAGRWFEELRQDARYAWRVLTRSRGYTIVGTVTLALGIGANTAIFTVVRGVLLRPLPFASPERLVAVSSVIRGTDAAVSVPDFLDFRAAGSFSGLAAYFTSTTNLTGTGEPERLSEARVSANFFDLLGTPPSLGRGFRAGEDEQSAPHVAVLSDGLWRRRFGADASIVGRTILLDDYPTTVIGVARPETRFPAGVDLWQTTRFDAREAAPSARGARWIQIVGRLAPAASLTSAQAEMTGLAARLSRLDPRHNESVLARVVTLRDALVGDVRRPLLVLLGAVLCVMLIACVNVASLALGRTAARDGELAVRVALGAGRSRIARQLLTESLALSATGGVIGVLVAWLGMRALIAAAPAELPMLHAVRIDGVVLAFALGLTVLSGILFGVVPAVAGARADVQDRLRAGGRGGGRPATARARQSLVVVEIALAMTLLAGAGLLARSFAKLATVDPGFRSDGVSTFSVSLPPLRYPSGSADERFATTLLSRISALPRVDAAGISFGLPLSGSSFGFTFAIAGRPDASGPDEPRALARVASSDYFRAMGIRLLRGRGFTAADRENAPPVVVISAEAARRYWPNDDPIGSTISTGWRKEGRNFGGTIVGIVGDVRPFSLADKPAPFIYVPLAQWPLDEMSVVVRSSSPASTVLAAARGIVSAIDPQLPVYDAHSLDEVVRESTAPRRFYALLFAIFATLALTLAAVGIYGVIAYAVQQRRRELGIRVALGASRERVVALVMRQGITLAAIGAGAGLVGAGILTRVLQGQLFGVSATDPLTFVLVPLVLLAVAVGACVVPVLRALRVDPASAIRAEN